MDQKILIADDEKGVTDMLRSCFEAYYARLDMKCGRGRTVE